MTPTLPMSATRFMLAIACGWLIGTLGGLIGLGGAEFRLPLLISLFGFAALSAVILNKAMSLIVVTSALLFRSTAIPLEEVASHWPILLNLLSGSLLGAWFGAGWALRMSTQTLYRVLATLLMLIALVLLFGHSYQDSEPLLSGGLQLLAGVASGFGIGIVASLMGVAGGELLIPTLVLLFGADIKLAGSLSLAVSLPTMLVGFARYSRDSSFVVIRQHSAFVLAMALGSLLGTWTGGHLLGMVSAGILMPLLALILVISSIKVWRHP